MLRQIVGIQKLCGAQVQEDGVMPPGRREAAPCLSWDAQHCLMRRALGLKNAQSKRSGQVSFQLMALRVCAQTSRSSQPGNLGEMHILELHPKPNI